ncbi:MAG: carboxypeptidase regulatory-like domain-containing protein, partial [Crocinitomicaceae bacterium]|nr:carboxypeptidase regulatory-like domain-containing protein [Crocinitomicaceae bacterium]
MKFSLLVLSILFLPFTFLAQSGVIKGRVYNNLNNKPVPDAKVLVIDQAKGAITLEDGTFEISGLNPGVYSIKATSVGFKELVLNEIIVTNARSIELDFALEELVLEQKEVTVKATPFVRKSESPTSLKTLNASEIE